MTDRIRDRLQKFRQEAGLTSEELARVAGVKIDSLRRYESGGTGIPSDTLFRLARALGRSADDFYVDHPPPADLTALPRFHAWAAPGDMDDFEAEKYREVQELISKANSEVRAHRKRAHGKTAEQKTLSNLDKKNKPKK